MAIIFSGEDDLICTLKMEQNDVDRADDIFNCNLLYENHCIINFHLSLY